MKNVRKLRGKKGLSQLQLAKELNVTRASIIRLESDEVRKASPQMEKKLCEFFGVSVYALYGTDILLYKPQTKEELKTLIDQLNEEYEEWDY